MTDGDAADSYFTKTPDPQLLSEPLRMAPSVVYMAPSKLSPREKNKIRKPAVEKMRRDRINSSIEQLKRLLEAQFQAQPASAKLEKADILEMAVNYLKEQSQTQSAVVPFHKHPSADFQEGYSRCFEEALHFLSAHNAQLAARAKLLHHHSQQGRELVIVAKSPLPAPKTPLPGPKPICAPPAVSSALWRPW